MLQAAAPHQATAAPSAARPYSASADRPAPTAEPRQADRLPTTNGPDARRPRHTSETAPLPSPAARRWPAHHRDTRSTALLGPRAPPARRTTFAASGNSHCLATAHTRLAADAICHCLTDPIASPDCRPAHRPSAAHPAPLADCRLFGSWPRSHDRAAARPRAAASWRHPLYCGPPADNPRQAPFGYYSGSALRPLPTARQPPHGQAAGPYLSRCRRRHRCR